MKARMISALCAVVVVWGLFANTAMAEDMNYALVYEQASKSVVFIAAFLDEDNGKQGSGFVLTPEGYILTNRHVIWNDAKKQAADRIIVFLRPDKITGRNSDDLIHRTDAKLVATSETLDLALLKIDAPKPLEALVFAPSDTAKIGTATAAIGHPVGGARWSLTTGRISGRTEDHGGIKGRQMIQMETSLNPGNSGGPLLNAAGQVVGVNTATIRQGPGGVVIEGINFAISAEAARQWLKDVMPKSAAKAPKVATVSKPLKPKKGQKTKEPKEKKPGTVYTPTDMEAMVEQMADEIQDEFERRRKQLNEQGF